MFLELPRSMHSNAKHAGATTPVSNSCPSIAFTIVSMAPASLVPAGLIRIMKSSHAAKCLACMCLRIMRLHIIHLRISVLADRLHQMYYGLYGVFFPSPVHGFDMAIGDQMYQLQLMCVMSFELIAALGFEQYRPQSLDSANAPGPALHLFRIVVRQHASQHPTCRFKDVQRLHTCSSFTSRQHHHSSTQQLRHSFDGVSVHCPDRVALDEFSQTFQHHARGHPHQLVLRVCTQRCHHSLDSASVHCV